MIERVRGGNAIDLSRLCHRQKHKKGLAASMRARSTAYQHGDATTLGAAMKLTVGVGIRNEDGNHGA